MPRYYADNSVPNRIILGNNTQIGQRRGVLGIPSDTGLSNQWSDGFFYYTNALADDGNFAIGSCDHGTLWGNNTMQTRLTTLRTNMLTNWSDPAKTALHLLGISAGGIAALRFAKANPTFVKSIFLVIPCLDLQDIYDNNRGGFQAEINTAYGARPADADNPAKNYGSFTGFPIKIYYSDTDPVTPLSVTQAFASGVGSNVSTVSMGSLGHLWGAPLSDASFLQFLNAND